MTPTHDFDPRFTLKQRLIRGAASPSLLGPIGRLLGRGTVTEMAFNSSLVDTMRSLLLDYGSAFMIALVAQFRPEGPIWLEISDPKLPFRHGYLCTGTGVGPLRVHHVILNSDGVPDAFPIATWRFETDWCPRIDWTNLAAAKKLFTKKLERKASEWAEAHIAALELEPDVEGDAIATALMFGFSDLIMLSIAHSPLVTPIPARLAA